MVPYSSLLELIGNTPLIELGELDNNGAKILLKMENMNPLASVKDRLAFAMIQDAEKKGLLKKGSTIIEASSGNTGIALAYISAIKGYKLILTMPESMSIERRQILQAFGVELILTPKEKGMKGAVEEAENLYQKNKGSLRLDQFSNPANPEFHYNTTGRELLEQSSGKIDVFLAGVGTGGTISGVGKRLKEFNPAIKIVAVEPFDSAVLSGGKASPHKIQGIGAGFVPAILNRELIDEIIKVKFEDAERLSRLLMLKKGIFSGISSGANLWSALELSRRPEYRAKTIVTVICDTGERYLSTKLFNGGIK